MEIPIELLGCPERVNRDLDSTLKPSKPFSQDPDGAPSLPHAIHWISHMKPQAGPSDSTGILIEPPGWPAIEIPTEYPGWPEQFTWDPDRTPELTKPI